MTLALRANGHEMGLWLWPLAGMDPDINVPSKWITRVHYVDQMPDFPIGLVVPLLLHVYFHHALSSEFKEA